MFGGKKKRDSNVKIEDLEQSAILGKRTQSRGKVIESADDSEFEEEEDRSSELSS